MRMLIIIVAVVGLLIVVGMYLAAQQRRRPKSETQPEVADAPRADEFPTPGEPAPHRPDGTPVPGSMEDRHEHGKP